MSSPGICVRPSEIGHAGAAWTGGLTVSGAISLLAVVAVLIVVSLPRLRGLAVQENEGDARATAQLLAGALGEPPSQGGPVPKIADLLRRPELLSLSDAELFADGRVLRRHGYLFEVAHFSPPAARPGALEALPGCPAIRAWPWAHGRTGIAAYVVAADGTSLEHENQPPLWQGPEAAGSALLDPGGWRAHR